MKKMLFLIIVLCFSIHAQNPVNGGGVKTDTTLSHTLQRFVKEGGLDKEFDTGDDGMETISLAVIDLTGKEPVMGGVYPYNFIYPASVYKMYVAAEALEQVSQGKYSLYSDFIVKAPNAVDNTKEIKTDPRPLLKENDTVTVNYLLDLMITRSDNSAANCLIDLTRRENVNNLLHQYGWFGSEVTRKFLSRKYEDPGYDKVRGTVTCAQHAAEFMLRVQTNTLVNPWVSLQMKALLARQLDKSKLAAGLPANVMYSHKTGWFSYWTNDVGIVEDGKICYIVSCFVPVPEEQAIPKMKELSGKIYNYIKSIHPEKY